jgi:hypothetical protein
MGWCGLNSSGSGEGPVESSCEHNNEPSGCLKFWEILEDLSNWQHPMKDSSPWS